MGHAAEAGLALLGAGWGSATTGEPVAAAVPGGACPEAGVAGP
jgi:hypothetical protein